MSATSIQSPEQRLIGVPPEAGNYQSQLLWCLSIDKKYMLRSVQSKSGLVYDISQEKSCPTKSGPFHGEWPLILSTELGT